MRSSKKGQKKDFVTAVMGNLALVIYVPINNLKSLFWEKDKMKKTKKKELVDVMKQQFPAFYLEDKVALLGQSIVRLPITQVYEGRTHASIR